MSKDRIRLLLACVATLAIVLPLGYLWQQSRMPSTYSVMDMGYLDFGGGSRTGAALPGGQSMAGMHAHDATHGKPARARSASRRAAPSTATH